MAIFNITIESDKQALKELKESIMGLSSQVAELTAGMEDVKAQTVAAAERVIAKLAELQAKMESLGEPDPDLTGLITDARAEAEALKGIVPAEPVA